MPIVDLFLRVSLLISQRSHYSLNRRGLITPHAPQRNHGLNIGCHAAEISGQAIEEVAFPCVGRKFANEGAILGIGQQLFKPCPQVFHDNPPALPSYTARRSGEMSCE